MIQGASTVVTFKLCTTVKCCRIRRAARETPTVNHQCWADRTAPPSIRRVSLLILILSLFCEGHEWICEGKENNVRRRLNHSSPQKQEASLQQVVMRYAFYFPDPVAFLWNSFFPVNDFFWATPWLTGPPFCAVWVDFACTWPWLSELQKVDFAVSWRTFVAVNMALFRMGILLLLATLATIQERVEQRATLKFLAKSGFSPIECWNRLKTVWRDKTLGKMQIRFWHKRFLNGLADTKDKKRSGRPRTKTTPENIQAVSDLLQNEGKLSLREICSRTSLKMGVVVRIVKKELRLKKCPPKFMPTELTDEQKDNRKEVSEQNLQTLCDSPDPEIFL